MPFPAAAIIPLGPGVRFYAFRSAAHVFLDALASLDFKLSVGD